MREKIESKNIHIVLALLFMVGCFQHLFCANKTDSKLLQWLDYEEQISEYVSEQYRNQYKQCNIIIDSMQITIPLQRPQGDWKLLNLSMGKNAIEHSSGYVIATIKQNNNTLSLPIHYALKANMEILRALRVIKSQEPINSENVKKEKVPMPHLRSMPLCVLNQHSARSIIGANAIITLDKTQPLILIKKNELFIGIFKQQNIEIQIQLKALENGMKDEVINAQNIETKKVLRVRVIDDKQGEVL